MQCRTCETELSARALFCEVCGQRVVRPAETAPAPPRARTMVAERPAAAPSAPPLPREELGAAVAAREELGTRMEPEVIEAFLARIESAVITRVDARVDERLRGAGHARRSGSSPTVPVAICSLIFGIPLSAIAGEDAGLAGLLVCWLGIAAVNFAVNIRDKVRP